MRLDIRLFVWAPRVLGIATALFFAMFAWDVFDEAVGLAAASVALLVHLVPAALVATLVVVAWRRELAGALGFATLGVVYLVVTGGRFPWTTYAAIAGPLFLTAALLVSNWSFRRHRRRAMPAG